MSMFIASDRIGKMYVEIFEHNKLHSTFQYGYRNPYGEWQGRVNTSILSVLYYLKSIFTLMIF